MLLVLLVLVVAAVAQELRWSGVEEDQEEEEEEAGKGECKDPLSATLGLPADRSVARIERQSWRHLVPSTCAPSVSKSVMAVGSNQLPVIPSQVQCPT